MEFIGERREKYKNMWDTFNQKELTKEHREQVERIVNGLSDHIISSVAKGRLHAIRKSQNKQDIDEQQAIEIVNKWFNIAGFGGSEAKDLGVVDDFGYKRKVGRAEISKLCNVEEKKVTFLFLTKYLEKKGGSLLKKPKTHPIKELATYKRQTVAVVYATGSITRGDAPGGYEDNSKTQIYGDNIARALYNAAEDKAVKCIILRVDSGGGDAIGSEIINHEIERIRKEKSIKIVVSMGSVAASGGYWISMNADSIVANELTVTGSIGVVFGKIYSRQFWTNKLGVTFDGVKKHKLSDIQSSLHKYDEEQQQVIKKVI
jgi:protease-4